MMRLWSAAWVLVALMATGVACHDGPANSAAPPPDVELPGIDTHGFTPRERREFAQYVRQLPAPCADVAAPIAQCVRENRPCAACGPAAQAIAQAVREGMAREQVEELYKKRFDATTSRPIPLEGSPSRGPETAPVVIVEFADFECPFCQKLAPELDALWQEHKDEVRFVYKFMPLSMHVHGESAARAAIAAQAQGKFWEMHRQLFANGQHLEMPDLETYARAIGLDVDRFRADMQSPAVNARLEADRKLAEALGVKGTPAIYIDGREYDSKIDIREWIEGEVAQAKRR